MIWYFVVLFSRSLKFFCSKNRISFPFCLIGDKCFVECSIVEVCPVVVEMRGYSFLFLEQSLKLLKIDWLLVLWRFLKIDRWRHHFYFCLFRRNCEKRDEISILKNLKMDWRRQHHQENEFCFIFEENILILWFDKSWGFSKNRMMTSSVLSWMFHFRLSLEKWMSLVLSQRKVIF